MTGPDRTQQTRLIQVTRAYERASRAQQDLERAIVRASEVGCSLRRIAAQAQISYEQVRRILKDAQS